MFLTAEEIEKLQEAGDIKITPFDPQQINPNSYNVRLDEDLLVYEIATIPRILQALYWLLGKKVELDTRSANRYYRIKIPEEGLVLQPGILYLGSTIERTFSPFHVPLYEGRSSTARLGLESHVCGGWGDIGWEGQWTLEIRVTHPTRVYPGMSIGQVAFAEVTGAIVPYGAPRFSSRYQGQTGVTASKMHDKNASMEAMDAGELSWLKKMILKLRA